MAAKASSPLYSENGIELPTHTTSHNQVIVAAVPAPSGEIMDNYLALKNERDASWDDIAANVEPQDPVTADYLRKNGPQHESVKADQPGIAPILIERAVNPLTTPDERDRVAQGAPIGTVEAKEGPVTP
jgi:hypothetical protein